METIPPPQWCLDAIIHPRPQQASDYGQAIAQGYEQGIFLCGTAQQNIITGPLSGPDTPRNLKRRIMLLLGQCCCFDYWAKFPSCAAQIIYILTKFCLFALLVTTNYVKSTIVDLHISTFSSDHFCLIHFQVILFVYTDLKL